MRARVLYRTLAIALLATVAACDDDDPTGPGPDGDGVVHVINGTENAVRVKVDGDTEINSLGAGEISAAVEVTEGTRTVTLESLSGGVVVATSEAEIMAADDGTYYVTATGLDVASFDASAVADTAAVPASGMTKVRVIHLAAAAPAFDLLRKQPDFPDPVAFTDAGVFVYGEETPYVQSAAGTWDIILEGAVAAGPFAGGDIVESFVLAGGDVITVAILDGPGGSIRVERLP